MMVRGQWGNLARMPRLHPYSFSKDILGFLMTTASQDHSLTSHPKDGAFYSIVSPSLHWGVRTHTDHRVSTPCWPHQHLFQKQPSFSQEVSHPGTDQVQPCLALVGNRSWAAGWYGCWQSLFIVTCIQFNATLLNKSINYLSLTLNFWMPVYIIAAKSPKSVIKLAHIHEVLYNIFVWNRHLNQHITRMLHHTTKRKTCF